MRLVLSNRVEALAEALTAELSRPKGAVNALLPEVVVVQSQGMAQWLRLELASRLGVCMNVEFPFPRKFILDTLDLFHPNEPRSASWEPALVTWRIFQLLPESSARPGSRDRGVPTTSSAAA